MRAIRLALSFLQIPRLFASLVLFPMLLGFYLLICEFIVVQAVVINLLGISAEEPAGNFLGDRARDIRWRLLYGDRAELPPLKVCRWVAESTPGADCVVSGSDIALHVANPAAADVEPLRKIYEGNVERLHVCKSCLAPVVIEDRDGRREFRAYSWRGMLLASLFTFNPEIYQNYRDLIDKQEVLFQPGRGTLILDVPGLRSAINMNDAGVGIVIVMTFAFLLFLTLLLHSGRIGGFWTISLEMGLCFPWRLPSAGATSTPRSG
jgi:hypothetical protein